MDTEEYKLDDIEKDFVNNIFDFENFLKEKLLNKEQITNNLKFDKFMEEKSRELLEEYLGLEKNHPDTMAKKDEEDTKNFLIKNILIGDLLTELKKKYGIKNKKKLAEHIVKNKIEPYYSDALKATDTNLEDLRYKNVLFDIKTSEVRSGGSGGLIALEKMKNKILKNKLKMFYIFYKYKQEKKKYIIIEIIIVDIYSIDFSQLTIQNKTQIYYYYPFFKDFRQENKEYTIEQIKQQIQVIEDKTLQKYLDKPQIKKIIDNYKNIITKLQKELDNKNIELEKVQQDLLEKDDEIEYMGKQIEKFSIQEQEEVDDVDEYNSRQYNDANEFYARAEMDYY